MNIENDILPVGHSIGCYQDKELRLLLPITGLILLKDDGETLTLMDGNKAEYTASKKDLQGERRVYVPLIDPSALTKIKNAPDAGTSEANH